MPMIKRVQKTRRAGRPTISGGEPMMQTVPVRLPDETVDKIDKWCAKQGMGISRSQAIRWMLSKQLEAMA